MHSDEGHSIKSNRHDNAPGVQRMFHQLMGACYLIQRNNLGDLKPLPARLECLIDGASGTDLSIGRNIVTADEEYWRS